MGSSVQDMEIKEAVADIKDFVRTFRKLAPQLQPILKSLPAVTSELAPFVAGAAAAVLQLGNETTDDTALVAQFKKFAERRAHSRAASLKQYMQAGFKRHEAMQLVLMDAANVKANISITTESIMKELNRVK